MTRYNVTPAEAALRFIGMFGEVQVTLRHVFDRYLEALSPEVSTFVVRRLGRMSDLERFAALSAIAADHGQSERGDSVVEVAKALKRTRDVLGHARIVGSDDSTVFALVDMDAHEFSVDELLSAYGRAQWVVESALFIGHMAGVMTHDGTPYNRHSGATLLDAPPPMVPPDGPLKDPVVLLEPVDDE